MSIFAVRITLENSIKILEFIALKVGDSIIMFKSKSGFTSKLEELGQAFA
jgi:hypothetical protein